MCRQVNEALNLLELQAELANDGDAKLETPGGVDTETATLRLGQAAATRCRRENAELVERVKVR